MSSRRFDQFDQFVFVVSYRIQPPQNVCLDDRDRFLFERRLDIVNVPFHASKISDISERASRSDYTHEENSSLIRSIQGTCGRAWRIVGAIFNDCNECWKVSIEDRVYGTIVLYRIILYGKCNCEEWLIDVHILIVFRGRWNYIFHSVGSISSIHDDVTGHRKDCCTTHSWSFFF